MNLVQGSKMDYVGMGKKGRFAKRNIFCPKSSYNQGHRRHHGYILKIN